MLKKATKSICTSTILVSPENAEEDPEPADEGNIQMEYSSDYN